MNNRLMRPCLTLCGVVAGLFLRTVGGSSLITQDGSTLRAIQNA